MICRVYCRVVYREDTVQKVVCWGVAEQYTGALQQICRRSLKSELQSDSQVDMAVLQMYCSEGEGEDDLLRMTRALGCYTGCFAGKL